jgi:Do/DeqQ family serine protease
MKTFFNSLTMAALGASIALCGYFAFFPTENTTIIKETESTIPAKPVSIPTDLNGNVLDFQFAANQTLNSVVHINTETKRRQLTQEEQLFELFYGNGGANRSQRGSGSGVIISEDGYIVTNNHVVEKADIIRVILNDNREYTAKVIGTDPATDMAVIKIDETNLPPIAIGNSDEINVGEWVLAVGNPFNLTSTVTAGIVSAKGRSINIMQRNSGKNIFPIESFIQTDAAVNPGNSGGALVNSKGELVGINTAIASQTGSYSGYSFAVPVNIMKKVTTDMIQYGIVQRAFIGVGIQEMNQELANELGIKETEGVFVNGVSPNGAAEEAGIEKGDVIVKVNKESIKSVPQLQEKIGKYAPGDKVEIALIRDGDTRLVSLTLRNYEGNTEIIKKTPIESKLAASFEVPSKKELEKMRLEWGVKVTEVGKGKLQDVGISKGFVITKVDKRKVTTVEELTKALEKAESEGVLIEGVYPNGMKAYYGMGK